MGFDDLCNSSLLLGLALTQPPNYLSQKPNNNINNNNKPIHFFNLAAAAESDPSLLTLGLSTKPVDLIRQPSPDRPVSLSFSGGRLRRERDVSGEDVEEEKGGCCRVSDEDEEDGSNCRKKLRLTKQQSALLEDTFNLHTTNLNPKEKLALARELNLRPRQVEVWFQNRRARTKLKQTEVDCEFLKRCYETLTCENKRLQKELQELKALNLAQPMFMSMPAATLTVCPSCERIGSVTATVNSDVSSMAPKPRFYQPFTNPSAAC